MSGDGSRPPWWVGPLGILVGVVVVTVVVTFWVLYNDPFLVSTLLFLVPALSG